MRPSAPPLSDPADTSGSVERFVLDGQGNVEPAPITHLLFDGRNDCLLQLLRDLVQGDQAKGVFDHGLYIGR